MIYLSAERIKSPDFPNRYLRRNYNILEHYLDFLTGTGLDFLKREFIGRYADSSIKKFSAQNFFHFILRDYIENKVRSQVQIVLETAASCVTHLDNEIIDPDYLDEIIKNLDARMDEIGASSIDEVKGSMSLGNYVEPTAFERSSYIKLLQSYGRI